MKQEISNIKHLPDILNFIADLSSDEVFTPPNIAKLMLNNLPPDLWINENLKFLDPVSKTGVFLREITTRLIKGLEKKIPNLEKNIVHADALTLKNVNNKKFIVFSEWSLVNDKIKRRDFEFKNLIEYAPFEKGTLFSDLGDEVIIPSPIKEHPLVHFLDIIPRNGDQQSS